MWELLVPVLGITSGSQLLREFGIAGGQQLTKNMIRRYLAKDGLKQFQRLVLKLFGKKVLQRGLITKSVPIVGGAIGGTWNFVEVKIQGKRVIRYCSGEPL